MLKGGFQKALLSISSIFILLAILLSYMADPPSGYETSLYESQHPSVWLLLIVSSIISTYLMVRFYQQRPLVFGALVNLLTVKVVFLVQPLIRGYYYYGSSDARAHVGYLLSYAESGHIPHSNAYPLFYNIALNFTAVTGVSVYNVQYFIFFIFSLLFALTMFAVVYKLTKSSKASFIILALSLIPIFGTVNLKFAPFEMSVLFLPTLILMFVFVSIRSQPKLSLHIMLFYGLLAFIILLHPLTGLLFGATFAINYMIKYAKNKRGALDHSINPYSPSFLTFIIMIVALYQQSYLFGFIARMVNSHLTGTVGNSSVQRVAATLAQSNLWAATFNALMVWGSYALIIAFTLISLYLLNKRRAIVQSHFLLFFSLSYLFLALATLLFSVLNLGINEIEPRPIQILTVISMVLLGIACQTNILEDKGIVSVLAILIIISSVSFFPDPSNLNSNWQLPSYIDYSLEFTIGVDDDAMMFTDSYDYKAGLMLGYDPDQIDYIKHTYILENGLKDNEYLHYDKLTAKMYSQDFQDHFRQTLYCASNAVYSAGDSSIFWS